MIISIGVTSYELDFEIPFAAPEVELLLEYTINKVS